MFGDEKGSMHPGWSNSQVGTKQSFYKMWSNMSVYPVVIWIWEPYELKDIHGGLLIKVGTSVKDAEQSRGS